MVRPASRWAPRPHSGVAGFPWNQWQLCYGISGNFRVEQVAALAWNRWQDSPGISGSFGVEYAVGCTEREQVYHRHAQFVQDDQFWGHWAHKRQDAQGRSYYLAPAVMLGQAWGRVLDPLRLRRALRLRQGTRTVWQYGQIRLHKFGVYCDE